MLKPRQAVWPVGPYLLACGGVGRSGIKTMNDIPKNGTRERLGVEQSVVECVASGCAHAAPPSVQGVTRCSRQRYSHTKSPS